MPSRKAIVFRVKFNGEMISQQIMQEINTIKNCVNE